MRGLRWVPLLLFVLLDPLGLLGQGPGQPKDKTDPSKTQGEIDGRGLDEWVRDLGNPDASIREEALRAMMLYGKDASTDKIIETVLNRTLDKDVSPRNRALQALTALDIPPTMLPKVLSKVALRLTTDSEAGVKLQAAQTLHFLTVAAIEDDRDNKPFAKQALAYLAETATPALLSGAKDMNSWEIRRASVLAIGDLGRAREKEPPDPNCVRALLGTVKDTTFQVRMESVRSLGKLGKPGDPALAVAVEAELRRLAQDKDKVVSIWAWMSLMCVTEINPDAVKAITSLMQDKEARIRNASIRALTQIGEHAHFAVPELTKLLKDPDIGVQVSAIHALCDILDKPNAVAISGLQALADDKEAKKELKRLAADAIEYIRAGKKMVDKPDPEKKK